MVRSILKLAGALVLVLGLSAALPAAAEAGHRHSRHCRHGSSYYDGDYGYSGRRGSSYYYNDYGYSGYSGYPRYGYSYEYRYRPRPYYYSYYEPYSRYYYAPRHRTYVHYHRGIRCSRPHVSISFGF